MPRRSPIQWPDGARIAVIPCVAFETWPDDVGTPNSLNRSYRPPLPGRTPRELGQIWKDTFDVFYAEGATSPKMMAWGLHPFLTGRPYRAAVLQEFIRYAKGHPGVWFPRCIDVARWWREKYRDHHVETWPSCLSMTTPPIVSRFSVAG